MDDQPLTVAALKELLGTIHVIRQRERIRLRIYELQSKGLSDAEVIQSLRDNPPITEMPL
ncbi:MULTISPECIES: hypothetical protein [Pseudomonas]|uniref:hypothetical protein n=1 Tax=Pseudomonas TaxID=286 RepID=UPI000736493D|nr:MULTISPECIES: hypothetical protein [Pseudomonas]KTT64035.1 hypothetical protein NS383_17365 [Pseudomonas psychrotolerans]SEO71535.1 hypothetical protein SAMN02787149_1011090 [Pseudomonas sp. Snoq117.2]